MGRRRMFATVAAALLAAGASSAGPIEEFHAYLLPDPVVTEVDSLFAVDFFVDSTAHRFNGYEVTLQFDPAKVAWVDVLLGPLMSGACPSHFSDSTWTDSTVTYLDVLLCGGVSVDGPGVLSTFLFQAIDGGASTISIVSDPDLTFLDAGLYVRPGHSSYPRQVIFHDADVSAIGPETGVGPFPPGTLGGVDLLFHPNPTRAGGAFRLTIPRSGPASLRVVSAAGRQLLARDWVAAPAGASNVSWNATGPGGERLPNGVYFARLRTPLGDALEKVVLIR